MISNKTRESRKGLVLKMSKNIQRLYKDSKCSDCSVVVTRMDFAKILGKFTKVKIQYEKSTPRTRRNNQQVSSPNSRLKSNENGMVLLPRNAYSQHPVKKLLNTSKAKEINSRNTFKENSKAKDNSTPRQTNNILKENNRLKRTPATKTKDINSDKMILSSRIKRYGIVFATPNNKTKDIKNKLSLIDLLPQISKDILPSEEWCIDYFPKEENDKVYDRIAAELEDLMYQEKPKNKDKADSTEIKIDEFPSIMDILNDNSSENIPKESNEGSSGDGKTNLDSSDVEAMLLGKSDDSKSESNTIPMEVDKSDVSNLLSVGELNQETKQQDAYENPDSPSVLDEALQKGIEEQLPINLLPLENSGLSNEVQKEDSVPKVIESKEGNNAPNKAAVTHVIFKKSKDGKCSKSVTCPKNLKYIIELDGKSVELLGAPKLITSSDDLQVLLQIVDETGLDNLYVLH